MHRLSSSNFIKKWASILFWTALFTTTVLMFIPDKSSQNTGFKHWDKVQHALVFMLLIKLAWLAYPHKKLFTALSLVIFGAVIEILQTILTTTRIGSTGDWMADIVGILLGICICALLLSNEQANQISQ